MDLALHKRFPYEPLITKLYAFYIPKHVRDNPQNAQRGNTSYFKCKCDISHYLSIYRFILKGGKIAELINKTLVSLLRMLCTHWLLRQSKTVSAHRELNLAVNTKIHGDTYASCSSLPSVPGEI